ncbi:hypothetical protein DICPUDRAFT_89485 [Dictyostelium purpureum]|uniref:Phosphoglycerate mutase n=1 Tax=Dictyostelium purpureum TaxID=5786 RepID=F0ZW62_DICPU|nr:uncharacterized protein DICPUDRAFT_89485 [Dictyostelium purpureum]EGC31813.1 hypothetical protein DICPUDRAFT_89485 [Dictyostelium purpureum]|eukprot:XP_003291647.1 hypothetical protein DICPUDRAFT_89485 [Dictyostelium purpureum]
MSIYITRHGLREDWINKAWKLTAARPSDSPLSAAGLQVAKELGLFCKKLDIKHVISSPMERCLQTSTQIADQLDIPIKVDYGVIEWVGPNPRQVDILNPLSNEELKKTYPRVDLSYQPTTKDIPKKETMEELHNRSRIAVEKLMEKFKNEPFIIVSHAATMIALGRGILKDDQYPIRTGVCTLSKFNFDKDQNKWNCEYTENGEQEHWTFRT